MAAPMESKDGSTLQKRIHDDDLNRRNALLFTATGLSVFLGFGYTIIKARRSDPLYFKKNILVSSEQCGPSPDGELLAILSGSTLVAKRYIYMNSMLIKADDFLPENGISLASKALAVASVLSVSTFGLVGFTLFKLCGVNNFHEFNAKLRTYFPNKPTYGRSDFKNLHELADYLVSEDRRVELEKKNKKKMDS